MALTCYNCGTIAPERAIVCRSCGGNDLSRFAARPQTVINYSSVVDLPWPWSAVLLAWPEAFVVGLFGPPGAGKSSVAALLRPQSLLTSEQTIQQAAAMLARVQADSYEPTLIQVVRTPAEVQLALQETHTGLIMLDSVTRCGSLHEQRDVLHQLDAWAEGGPGRRALVVMQVNAEGEPAGLTENEHLVDAIVGITMEESGQRRLYARKNRAGPLGVAYVELDAQGRMGPPKLQYSYSVEGQHGQYRLVPWPSPKTAWQGLLDQAFKSNARPGLASAGRWVPGYPHNCLSPADVAQRRAFAEAHGLKWLTPEEVTRASADD